MKHSTPIYYQYANTINIYFNLHSAQHVYYMFYSVMLILHFYELLLNTFTYTYSFIDFIAFSASKSLFALDWNKQQLIRTRLPFKYFSERYDIVLKVNLRACIFTVLTDGRMLGVMSIATTPVAQQGQLILSTDQRNLQVLFIPTSTSPPEWHILLAVKMACTHSTDICSSTISPKQTNTTGRVVDSCCCQQFPSYLLI